MKVVIREEIAPAGYVVKVPTGERILQIECHGEVYQESNWRGRLMGGLDRNESFVYADKRITKPE